ncbi:unnamed protein product, partial [Ectocarpus sp. 12 AP-2014]
FEQDNCRPIQDVWRRYFLVEQAPDSFVTQSYNTPCSVQSTLYARCNHSTNFQHCSVQPTLSDYHQHKDPASSNPAHRAHRRHFTLLTQRLHARNNHWRIATVPQCTRYFAKNGKCVRCVRCGVRAQRRLFEELNVPHQLFHNSEVSVVQY